MAARKARSILSHPELWQLLPEGTHAEAEAHEEPLGQAAAVAGATEGAAPGAEAGPSSGRSSPSRSKAVWVRASSVPSSSSTPAGVAEASPAVDVKAGASASSSSSSEQPGVAPSAVAAHHAQELQGSRYSLVGADLRQLGQLQEALGRAGWDPRWGDPQAVVMQRMAPPYTHLQPAAEVHLENITLQLLCYPFQSSCCPPIAT